MKSTDSGSPRLSSALFFTAAVAALIAFAPLNGVMAQSRDRAGEKSGRKEERPQKQPERQQDEKTGTTGRQQERGGETRRDDGRTGGDKTAGDRKGGAQDQDTGRGSDAGRDQSPPRRKEPDPMPPPRRGGDGSGDRRRELPDPRRPRDPVLPGKKIPGVIPDRPPKDPDHGGGWVRPDRPPIIPDPPGIHPHPPIILPPIHPPRPPYYPPPYIIDDGDDMNWIEVPDFMWDDPYTITLPFGTIMPWEIGEFFLIRLKDLEDEGYGESMIIVIVQMQDEMAWEEFLDVYAALITDVRYYGNVGPCSFLVAVPVTTMLDLLVDTGIRWAGEFRPIYKIEPGGRNQKFYVRSLEGDQMEFRRQLSDVGLDVISYEPETGEYAVFSALDLYEEVAGLWWVASVSSRPDNPFLRPYAEDVEVGMTARE